MEKEIKWLVKNWDHIPAQFKTDLRERWGSKMSDIPGVPDADHEVILLVDRQKPSVEADYSFNEERISVSRTGKIVWGFDSGCSCPAPWADSHPHCYSCTESWKEFELKDLSSFDSGALEECKERIAIIKRDTV